MSNISILIIPGACGRPEFYDPVVNPVSEKGLEIRGLHLPSVAPKTGPEGPPATMYEDAALIAKEIEKLADEGKDVILIPHSYGGVPATQSTKGLSKKERQADGKKGGVVRIAYMTSLVPAVGTPAMSVLAGVPEENKIDFKIDESGWLHHDPISESARIVFSDLPKEEGEAWIKEFSQHSIVCFSNELTHAGYETIPVSYFVCEDDLCIPLENQREGIALIEKVSGRKVDVTSVKVGHVPPVTQPKAVVDWILDVVRKAEEERAA